MELDREIKIFNYDPKGKSLLITDDYRRIAQELRFDPQNPAGWVGIYFCLDQAPKKLEGTEGRFEINPLTFQDGVDGPVHSDSFRKLFWPDVLSSLLLPLSFLVAETRYQGNKGLLMVDNIDSNLYYLADKETIPIFSYLPDLDGFVPTKDYQHLATQLNLMEWNPVVWIGRYFCMDNDYGEHWFDNWEAVDQRMARQLNIDPNELLIINPDYFTASRRTGERPYHSSELRKIFWTAVLKNMKLSLEMLFQEARWNNELVPEEMRNDPDLYVSDLEQRIAVLRREFRAITKDTK